ncbi:hypothetical protein D0S45_07485 [Marinifilum sp. JC120]|nr:hypothetical protein D0S45_07485 [Marinifilum sp. JC120]
MSDEKDWTSLNMKEQTDYDLMYYEVLDIIDDGLYDLEYDKSDCHDLHERMKYDKAILRLKKKRRLVVAKRVKRELYSINPPDGTKLQEAEQIHLKMEMAINEDRSIKSIVGIATMALKLFNSVQALPA